MSMDRDKAILRALRSDRRACVLGHLGLWACEASWLRAAVGAIKAAGGMRATWGWAHDEEHVLRARRVMLEERVLRAETPQDVLSAYERLQEEPEHEASAPAFLAASQGAMRSTGKPFAFAPGEGVAVIELAGPFVKGESKLGGVNTEWARAQVAFAGEDPEVRGVLLVLDSPGGMVAGTDELAQDVADLARKKPVHAHIEDLGASAAYWVASQASSVSATKSTEVGSIGTMAVIEDTSRRAELEGVEVHVVSTGAFKGAGVDGTEIDEKVLGEVRRRVEAINGHFLEAVSSGRGLEGEALERVSTGQAWIAEEARELGLVDYVMRGHEAFRLLADVANPEVGVDRRFAAMAARIADEKIRGER